MRQTFVIACVLASVILAPSPAASQISRHPTGVNVNAMGSTTVFLTFGNLNGKVPVQAMWCGETLPATPDVGERCDPATIFGQLPARYDLSRPSGSDGLTDIMSIPPSVARRAYQAAAAGASSEFYYVRRFVDPNGGRDEYVTVTCRMTDGGARTPFGVTAVRVAFATEDALLAVRTGERVPPVVARIAFNGTGRLRGRWEVVRPGEQPPRDEDLLPEASLPIEQRAAQRRYTEVARFDVFLPPIGEFALHGPDPARLPSDAPGEYLLLLRIEASAEKEGESDLGATGTGSGVVYSGGVAGFAVPPLRYHVGGATAVGVAATGFRTLEPRSQVESADQVRFHWTDQSGALLYRLDVEDTEGNGVLSAVLRTSGGGYRAPSWLGQRLNGDGFRWRVAALGAGGGEVALTPWRTVRIEPRSR